MAPTKPKKPDIINAILPAVIKKCKLISPTPIRRDSNKNMCIAGSKINAVNRKDLPKFLNEKFSV